MSYKFNKVIKQIGEDIKCEACPRILHHFFVTSFINIYFTATRVIDSIYHPTLWLFEFCVPSSCCR